MREAQELAEPTYDYFAQPLSDNLFEWHFTVRGPAETEFDGGIYHGRIVLPPDYPMKPPNIIVLTVILTKNDTTSCFKNEKKVQYGSLMLLKLLYAEKALLIVSN